MNKKMLSKNLQDKKISEIKKVAKTKCCLQIVQIAVQYWLREMKMKGEERYFRGQSNLVDVFPAFFTIV